MVWLINSAQLDKFRKSQKSLIILDASWHMPDDNRDAKQEFALKHIIDAKFFDIDAFSDHSPEAPHPHMVLRDETVLSEKLGALGIRNDYKIILYDNSKIHTACRAAWMLKLMGHNPQQIYILDGGFSAWELYGGKVEAGEVTTSAKPYKATFQSQYLRTLAEMKANLRHPTEQVIDVRHSVRYMGGPELKLGIRPGHIPGSFSFPYTSLFEKNGLLRPLDKIRQVLTGIGVDLSLPIIATCGSGISSCALDFALDLLEHPHHSVYNGSWNEWGNEKLYINESNLDERPAIKSTDKEL